MTMMNFWRVEEGRRVGENWEIEEQIGEDEHKNDKTISLSIVPYKENPLEWWEAS